MAPAAKPSRIDSPMAARVLVSVKAMSRPNFPLDRIRHNANAISLGGIMVTRSITPTRHRSSRNAIAMAIRPARTHVARCRSLTGRPAQSGERRSDDLAVELAMYQPRRLLQQTER